MEYAKIMLFLIVIGLLFISAYSSVIAKTNQRRCVFGILTAVLSVIVLLLFLYLQKISGGADHGQILGQKILPIIGCFLAFLFGTVVYIKNRKP